MKKFFVFLIISSFLLDTVVVAQDLGGNVLRNTVGNVAAGTSLETRVGGIVAAILGMLGTVFLVLTIYAGVLWMMASGEEAKITKAKGILSSAIIGLAIVLSAYTITYFVGSRLGSGSAGDGDGCCTISEASGGEAATFNSPEGACISDDLEISASWSPTPCK